MQGIFEKIPLPQEMLSNIWELSDIGGDGIFTKAKFALAMLLLSKAKNNQPILSLPPNILDHFKDDGDNNSPPEKISPPSYKQSNNSEAYKSQPKIETSYQPTIIKQTLQPAYRDEPVQQNLHTNEQLNSKASEIQNNIKMAIDGQIASTKSQSNVLSQTESAMISHLAFLKQLYERDCKLLKELTLNNQKLEASINSLSNDCKSMEKKINDQKEHIVAQQKKGTQIQRALEQKLDERKKVPVQRIDIATNFKEPIVQAKQNPFSQTQEKPSEVKTDMKAFDSLATDLVPSKEAPKDELFDFNKIPQKSEWLNFEGNKSTPLEPKETAKEFEFGD